MSITQSDTRKGMLPLGVSVDLTGKEGLIAKIVPNVAEPGKALAALPTANTDDGLYLIEKGAAVGEYADLIPLESGCNQRVYAKGTGLAGQPLVLADPATPADAGKVEVTATAGTYFSPGIAEEDFEDGQLVRFRPYPRSLTIV